MSPRRGSDRTRRRRAKRWRQGSLRHWPERIKDMLQAARECTAFTAGMTFEQFRDDAKTMKAVIANIAIIGEAARYVPDKIAEKHQHIPWDDMREVRNMVIHAYFGVDPRVMWETVHRDVPRLIHQLEAMER
jgi:uncharacterized protein with HEPN domain